LIDLHSHILPGVDDGAESLEESIEIARAAVAEGITILAATPHVRSDFPTVPETTRELVVDLRRALAHEGVPLDVRSGAEIALDYLPELPPTQLGRYGLGGNPSYLLLEFPYYGWPLALPDALFELKTLGITGVIAHPERNPDVQADPTRLRPLVAGGALVQVTAASLDGRFGRSARAAAVSLIGQELAHLVASDSHSADVRAVGMREAVAAVADEELARWLVHDVPAAIVGGEPLPPRPARRRAGFGARFIDRR
jgi:protein-tyrosine phosphatase